jgi:hypothetical protein
LSLPFTGANDQSIDSGFGPFALTRLCFETGGGYFAIHPNRRVGRTISSGEIEPFASQITRFFDPQRMRMYRPDYVSIEQYLKNVKSSALRGAVVRAAASSVDRLRDPELVFVKRDEATFVATLTDAQKAAARLEPKLNAIYETLKAGEEERQLESSLRWQAAYDLAMGQTLAVLVRTRAYNEMLAQAKRGMTPRKDDSNTWRLAPDDEISLGSRLEKMAERAREYLQRVVDQHDGTPWADVAERELATPLGWKWQESYTELARNDGDSQGSVNNAASDNQPRNEQRRMLPPPPPRRELPRL